MQFATEVSNVNLVPAKQLPKQADRAICNAMAAKTATPAMATATAMAMATAMVMLLIDNTTKTEKHLTMAIEI